LLLQRDHATLKPPKAGDRFQVFYANAISPLPNEAFLSYVYFEAKFRHKDYDFRVSYGWRLLKVSTNAGFAIGSPGVPRVVYASDQIRAIRVIAYEFYQFHYISIWLKMDRNSEAKGYS
jgi:hypothetical protein